jgi:hypothetical protein
MKLRKLGFTACTGDAAFLVGGVVDPVDFV